MTSMTALCYDRTGPAREVLVLRDLPRPEPGPGEVLVRIAMSGANPSDAKTRAGLRAPIPYPLVIPHSDGAGRIEAPGAGGKNHLHEPRDHQHPAGFQPRACLFREVIGSGDEAIQASRAMLGKFGDFRKVDQSDRGLHHRP